MEWLIAIALGGFIGLDATSFPQAMYSRPFVAGAIGGLCFGRPIEGLVIGSILEFFSLPVLPFGATAYPEGGTAAVASVIAYDWTTAGFDAELLFLSVAFGLPLSHATGYSVRLLRERNSRTVGRYGTGEPVEPDALERDHVHAMTLDFVRGALVTTAGAAVLALLLGLADRAGWSLPIDATSVLLVATTMMIGGSLTIFGTVRERIASFLVGVVLTLVAVSVL